ncbi:MAG: outer membrane lipid asymmetry maintenance protein MlaD [Candidatus Omnitrophica bacterium]|nr:outer membrane lipid asymmetry maintenance protein MlaD [Candidatus Omnitrophota bacterium]MCB9720396.1 outer membrane lipid asymmetry maintenance protein MlaD [Candidatus Omnitrophota bacterium]
MKKSIIEIIVGLFMVAGILAMVYISVNLGHVDFFSQDEYQLTATFSTVTGLKKDTNVEIAGVPVGKVADIKLKDSQAVVTLNINKGVKVQDDAIASIRTQGLLGAQFIELLPGASDVILEGGDEIFDTEPPFDLMLVIKNLAVDE